MRKYLLSKEGNFYKANLHCHTNLSDGKLSPEEVKELYKSHGYSVVAYTDHDLFIPHHELTDESFLALSGFEAEFNEKYPGNRYIKTCHICFVAKSPEMDIQPCWNEAYAYIGNSKKHHDKIKYDTTNSPFKREHTPECINTMISEARKAGFFVTYNHPAWSMENYEQYINYNSMNAMEILNYGCERMGFPAYAESIYDDMLRSGKKIFAIAADDNHNKELPGSPYSDSFGGYVMVKAHELKYESIMESIFNGNFYASGGPSIYDLYIEDGKIYVTCSGATKITLNTAHRSTKTVIAEENNLITSAVFDYNDDDVYLRITVIDSRGKCAFSNAYFVGTLK